MGYSGLDVDPDRLRVVAGEVAGAGVALRRAGTSRGPALAPAQGEAEGWVAAEAARTAATCWSGFLNRLASSVDALSGRLRTAAQSYVASDSRAEASLRKQYVE